MTSTIKYTLRNVPEPVNRYLREKSRLSGKSLNQVIIDELSDKVANPSDNVNTALARFIGAGMDEETLRVLAEDEVEQKALAAKELGI